MGTLLSSRCHGKEFGKELGKENFVPTRLVRVHVGNAAEHVVARSVSVCVSRTPLVTGECHV